MNERRICVSCMKPFSPSPIRLLLERDARICDECLSKINYEMSYEKIFGTKIFFLYYFNGFLEKQLVQYKEQLDYELRSFFLAPVKGLVRLFCMRKRIVLCPSTTDNLRRRGFNHLEEMLLSIGLPSFSVLKKDGASQKSSSLARRLERQELWLAKEASSLQGKDLILFDDVFTTGETFRQSLAALECIKPRSVRGLILLDNRSTS